MVGANLFTYTYIKEKKEVGKTFRSIPGQKITNSYNNDKKHTGIEKATKKVNQDPERFFFFL